MSLRVKFSRELPTGAQDLLDWKIEEASCMALATTIVILTLIGALSPSLLCHWYALMAAIALANSVRAIGGTHRYRSNELEASLSDQGADSVNIESGSIVTLLACPVGLRFHALHHLFPTIPYHSLGAAHRRLLSQLPSESPYRSRSVSSVWAGGTQVWRDSRAFSSSPVTHSHPG
jgi:fatty acid desaturase